MRAWAPIALIVGGALNILLWPVYTTLHGPGSVDHQGELLGQGTLFWGAMMEGPSGLLVAAGLAGSAQVLTAGGGTRARVGLRLAVAAAAAPALIDLALLAVVPPLFAPALAAGLALVALNRSLARRVRVILAGLAGTLAFGFLWLLLVRPDLLEQVGGYRIYGVVANVLYGVGWVVLGALLLRRQRPSALDQPVVAVPSVGFRP